MPDDLKILQRQLDVALDTIKIQRAIIDCAVEVMDWLAQDTCMFNHHGDCEIHGPMRDGKCLVAEWARLRAIAKGGSI